MTYDDTDSDADGVIDSDVDTAVVDTERISIGQLSSTPSDSEIPTDKVAIYYKDGDASTLYQRPNGGTESVVGGVGTRTSEAYMVNIGTDTSDREEQIVIPAFGKTIEVTRLSFTEKGGGTANSDVMCIIADGRSNFGNTLPSSSILRWNLNETFDTDDSAQLPFTLSTGNNMVMGVENNSGASVDASWVFEYRRV